MIPIDDGTTASDCYRERVPYPTHSLKYGLMANGDPPIVVAVFANLADQRQLARQRQKNDRLIDIRHEVFLPWCLAQNERIVARFLHREDCLVMLQYRAFLVKTYAQFLWWREDMEHLP